MASRSVAALQALALLAVIGPQWLVTRDLFDGATVALAISLGNPDGLYFWLSNANWLVAVLFFKFVFALSDVLGVSYLLLVKVTVTALLLALYCELIALGRRLFALPADEARLAALLCLASPSVYVFVNSGITPILLCVWLVFLGHRLFWHERVGVRLAGLMLLAVSFQLNSNLVVALALDVALLARFPGRRRERLRWFLLLVVTCLAVYSTMRLLAPPRQLFVEYNQLLDPLRPDDLRRMLRATAMFLTWAVIPLSVLGVTALVAALRRGRVPHAPQAVDWADLSIAVFLCCAAAFPYVLVGKGPPLFAYVGGSGGGLTEQVLRAAHETLLAPTWANTSARHGVLYAAPVAFLSWILARRMLGSWSSPALAALVLPLFLVWVLPAYRNKLEMQFAETSLAHGLKALPPAAAGVVDVHYAPVSDWLIWTNAGTGILRDAWGRAGYYAMFHSVNAYRDDMQWQYHAYFSAQGGVASPLIQRSIGMSQFPGADCQTRYEALLPQPSLLEVLAGGLAPDLVPAAKVRLLGSKCEPGQTLPNPYPEKKAIL